MRAYRSTNRKSQDSTHYPHGLRVRATRTRNHAVLLQCNVRHLRADRRRDLVLFSGTNELLLSNFLHGLHHDQLLFIRQYNWLMHSDRLDQEHLKLQHGYNFTHFLIHSGLHVDRVLHRGHNPVFLRIQRIQRDAFRPWNGRQLRNDGNAGYGRRLSSWRLGWRRLRSRQ